MLDKLLGPGEVRAETCGTVRPSGFERRFALVVYAEGELLDRCLDAGSIKVRSTCVD